MTRAATRRRKPTNGGSTHVITDDSDSAAPIAGLEGPVVRDDAIHFSPRDLLVYRLSETELENAIQAVELKTAVMERYQITAQVQLERYHAEKQALVARRNELAKAHSALQAEVETAYAIDLRKVAYDDHSGKITVIESK